jgi:hypothetical protein
MQDMVYLVHGQKCMRASVCFPVCIWQVDCHKYGQISSCYLEWGDADALTDIPGGFAAEVEGPVFPLR